MTLNEYPQRIETASLTLQQAQQRLEKLREQLSLMEQVAILGVLAARDEHGKPAFSNETARAAELARRLATHAEYQALKDTVLQTERDKMVRLAQLERLRSEFKLALLERQEVIAEKWLAVDVATMQRPRTILGQ